jgi:transposase
VAACAGLVPRLRESGKLVRGRARVSKMGTVRIRYCSLLPGQHSTAVSSGYESMGKWAEGARER